MTLQDFITIVILLIIIAGAATYIIKRKKRGQSACTYCTKDCAMKNKAMKG